MDTGFLTDHFAQELDWSGHEFSFPNMIVLNTIGDGNCFFHAIVQGFYDPYNEGYLEELREKYNNEVD